LSSGAVQISNGIPTGKSIAAVLALLGTAVASGVIIFVSTNASTVIPVVLFFVCFVVAISTTRFSWLPFGSRCILILLALRPLLDTGHSAETTGTNSSTVPVQGIYAVIFAAVLIAVWRKTGRSLQLSRSHGKLVILALSTVVVAWIVGGVKQGADGFVRTSWGLLVALFLGPLFSTRRQINLFIRVIFYSSVFFLFVLAFNADHVVYLDGVWRLGGQYGVPNALGAVAVGLFAYGLYAFDIADSAGERLLNLSLLGMLAIVITATQSRTAGGLMVISALLWLWVRGYRRVLYASAILLVVLLSSSIAANWRVTADIFGSDGQVDVLAFGLTGRTLLWGETIQNYLDASTVNKLIGLGWGTMYENFSFSKLAEVSSVTENSFLWFLAGAGVAGLAAFSSYLGWMCFRTWNLWRKANSKFDARFGFLAFVIVITFIFECFTFDLVLSPVASGYLYAILSISAYHELDAANERGCVAPDSLATGIA
jgi:O-antigen ligase